MKNRTRRAVRVSELVLCAALVFVASRSGAQQVAPATVVDVVYSTNAMERNASTISAAVAGVSRAGDQALAGIFPARVHAADKRGAALRLLKLALLDLPIVHYANGLNHEFGHMARAGELGMPLTFRLLGGPWSSPQFDLTCSQPWRLGLGTFGGGFEAEEVLERRLRDRINQEGRSSVADALTLLDGAVGRFYYVEHDLSTIRGRVDEDVVYNAGDPTRYVYEMTARRSGYLDADDVLANARSVRARAWLNFADADLWTQAWNAARYVLRGDTSFNSSWFHVRGVGLAPFSQFHLSPLGPQTQVGARYRSSNAAGDVTFRWTDAFGGTRQLGAGASWARTSAAVIQPRLRVDVWRGATRTFGARLEAGAMAVRWPSSRAGVQLAVGVKSDGYVLGLSEKHGAYVQAGLRLKF